MLSADTELTLSACQSVLPTAGTKLTMSASSLHAVDKLDYSNLSTKQETHGLVDTLQKSATNCAVYAALP